MSLRNGCYSESLRDNDFDARVGAHPSDFCFGKSHQNHSLCRAWMHKCRDARMARSGRDATLRVPCVPRQSRRKKNSGSSIPQTPFCFLRLCLRYSVAVQSHFGGLFHLNRHYREGRNPGVRALGFRYLSSRTLRSKVWRSHASRLPRSLRSLVKTMLEFSAYTEQSANSFSSQCRRGHPPIATYAQPSGAGQTGNKRPYV